MGCNCKVKQQISKIEKHYGTKILPSKKTNIIDNIKTSIKKMGYWFIIFPFIPLMLIFVFYRKKTKKIILIDKLIKK
jgi:hypothetical protein